MKEVNSKIAGKKFSLKTGRLAHQADGSVLAQVGETVVLATAVSSSPREGIDYFPLFVEYQEKLYAGGKIKGSRWVKREGRPSDEATLNARLIDRSIRPLFPKGYKNEVQVVITVLSVDGENDPSVLGVCAASAALAISDIPWKGPVGAIRVGLKADGQFITNPTYEQLADSRLDLVASATKKSIIMVEGGAKEVTEEQVVEALSYSQKEIEQIITLINQLAKKAGKEKQSFVSEKTDQALFKKVKSKAKKKIDKIIAEFGQQKADLKELNNLKEEISLELETESKKEISKIIDQVFQKTVRQQVLDKKIRIDNRKPEEIRPLNAEIGILPRTHGSAIFKRGLTQALTITTLGSPSLEQWIESMEGEETKRYIHHYYMPPYSVGETGRFSWPSRREVGHGSLAERALEPFIPSEDEFPYTIRVVSEITSSNGSTSMASVCGSSLSLMDAGVPIKKMVAGIAMGLIVKPKAKKKKTQLTENDYVVLTDILGLEDHLGDMDFKIAGTETGITGMQMDVKTLGITPQIMAKGLRQAKKARLEILTVMKKTLPAPRSQVSQHAPKIEILHIETEKIGDVIGPGGRTIRKIIKETGAAIDIDDEGNTTVSATDREGLRKAIQWVEDLIREVEVGEIFEGEVKRIEPYGVFVEILPGKKGLVHISEMSTGYVKHPSKMVSLGDKVKVKVKGVDERDRINLTMVLDEKPGQRQSEPRNNKSSKSSSRQR